MPTLSKIQVRPDDEANRDVEGGVCEMPVQTRLREVIRRSAKDMVISPPAQLPLFEGLEDESLVCPGCDAEVTSGVSALTVQALFQPPGRLLFHCKCDAYGEITGVAAPAAN